MKRTPAGVPFALLLALVLTAACTGGSETRASEEQRPPREAPSAEQKVDGKQAIADISSAIPVYQGAAYRDDLTRRDEAMIRNRYGAKAEVYTLATDDSFPQVYHYYTTYLAQFRAFPSQDTWPPSQKQWRTLEVQLNQVMQDSFIPGANLPPNGRQVTLQVAETEAEPKTVIRYIVTPGIAPVATTENQTSLPLAR